MASPINSPSQDISDLDRLTRLELEFRQARSKRRWFWPGPATLFCVVAYGYIAWSCGRDTPSPEDHLSTYLGLVTVMFLLLNDQQRHSDKRFETLEKHLADLTTELAHRARSQTRQG